MARPDVEEKVFSWRGLGALVRASASASRRFGAVVKALAELGLGVGRGEKEESHAFLSLTWRFNGWVAAIRVPCRAAFR